MSWKLKTLDFLIASDRTLVSRFDLYEELGIKDGRKDSGPRTKVQKTLRELEVAGALRRRGEHRSVLVICDRDKMNRMRKAEIRRQRRWRENQVAGSTIQQ